MSELCQPTDAELRAWFASGGLAAPAPDEAKRRRAAAAKDAEARLDERRALQAAREAEAAAVALRCDGAAPGAK